MSFSYYDNNNKKITELNLKDIQVGTNWNSLNIQNQQINSIFSKIDNGNGLIEQDELSMLEKLLGMADGILKTSPKNKILENEELDEVLKQIDEGKIKLSSDNEKVFKEQVTHHPHYTSQDYNDLNDPEKIEDVIKKYTEKIKADLIRYHRYDERFPEDRYEIEVVYNGRYFESNVYDKVSGQKYQGINDYNGIIDKSDFSKEDLEKLEESGLLRILNIDRAQGRMWTPELSKIVASILHNIELDEKNITVRLEHWGDNRDLVYDVETKTLKIVDTSETFGGRNFRKIQFDENGFVSEDSSCSILTTYKKNGKRYELGFSFINYLAEQEGFSISGKQELSEEQIKLYQELSEDINIWDKNQYKHDKEGNVTWSKNYLNGKIFEATRVDGVEDCIETDIDGNFISRSKYYRKEEDNTMTSVKEDLDEQGNFICKTTDISIIYDEPMILNKKGNTYTERTSETKTIKEFSDGRIEENIEFDEWECEELSITDTYEDIEFTRGDGIKFDIKHKNGYSSVINITTPNGKFSIDCEGYKYGNNYQENQLPKLNDVLKSIPAKVLEDLSNEISDIKLSDKMNENGRYHFNTNIFTYNTSFTKTTMSFVHEIGHAIDNQNDDMWSKNPAFSNKFARIKELAEKLIDYDNNHALDCAEEYFASAYADMEFPDGDNNHIKMLDRLILPFKDSQNPEEKELYELHISLKNDVKTRVEEVRKQPKNIRMDYCVTNIVKTELSDIIEILNKDSLFICKALQVPDGESLELEIISTLVSNDEFFDNAIKTYEKCSKNEVINWMDVRLEIPEESQQAFKELIPKLKEIRARLKK